MRILTDLDDTVFNFSDAFQQYLEDEFGMVVEARLRKVHNIQKLYGLDVERTVELVSSFHRSACMSKLAPEPCAAVVLPELHRRGYRFVAITACLNEPAVCTARQRNLAEVFGFPWEAVNCIGLKPCKKEALAGYPPSLWIDDLGRHAVAGAETGHRSFLINRCYNRSTSHPEVTRVTDWHDLLTHL